jgi:tRNA dimethylallyltransferase
MPGEGDSAILIAGPTASGKSALALRLAKARGGLIVNADSMQVYRELSVLTARPTAEDMAAAPHRLYGHVPAAETYSVGRWIGDVRAALEEAWRAGLVAIIVGGTGLYFKALTQGLSPIPAIDPQVRRYWRERMDREGAQALHAVLAARDAGTAAGLKPSDPQRVARALEVLDATGRPLREWQRLPGTPLIDVEAAERIVVALPRHEIVARADARFEAMLRAGALAEVERLGQLQLSTELPAMRALGVRPLMAHLAGRIDLATAAERSKAETRQYIKRQQTWLARNMIAWNWQKYD